MQRFAGQDVKKLVITIVLIYLYVFAMIIMYSNIFVESNKGYFFTERPDASETIGGIGDYDVVRQTFLCREGELSGFGIKFDSFGKRVTSSIYIELAREGEKKSLIAWRASGLKIKNQQYHYFTFEPIASSLGQKFVITIRYGRVEEDNFVSPMFSSGDDHSGGIFTHNGIPMAGTLAFTQMFRNPGANMTLGIGILICVIFLCFLVTVVFRFRENIEKMFFITAMTLGILYMIITPAFRAQDEDLHFYRAYEVSQGNMVSEIVNGEGGRRLPVSLKKIVEPGVKEIKYSDIAENFGIPLDSERTEFIRFSNSSMYNPISYLPQAMGISLARMLRLPPLWMVYFGRFFNLLLWALVTLWTLQILYFSRRMMFLIALCPMSLFTVSSLSADAITNALSLLFISYVMYLGYGRERRISTVQMVFLFVLCIGIALCKIVYAPLCLLALIIPGEKFHSESIRRRALVGLIAIPFIINLAWLGVASRYMQDLTMPGTDAAMQLSHLMANPFKFIMTIAQTLSESFNFYIQSFLGASLGWFDIPVAIWVTNVFVFALAFVTAMDNNYGVEISTRTKTVMSAVILVISTGIFVSLYLHWSRVAAPTVDGVQGRYFMPIMPLILLLFNNRMVRAKISDESFNFTIGLITVLLHFPVLITILLYHLG